MTYKGPYKPTAEHPDWAQWKLTDESWQQWRDEHPHEVAELRSIIAGIAA